MKIGMKMFVIYTLWCIIVTVYAGRSIGVVTDLEYNLFVDKLNNNYKTNPTLRTKDENSAVVRFYRIKEHLSLEGKPPKLYYKSKEVLNNSQFSKLVKKTFTELKGAGIKAIFYKLKEHYAGISRTGVGRVLKSDPRYIQRNLRFTNTAPLKHVTSSGVHEHLQIDIVDMKKYQLFQGDTTYRYILSVMDIFSRYVWLRPLSDKRSSTVSREFTDIIEEYGNPKIIQHDQGKEFAGEFKALMTSKNIKVFKSRPYHPQSQGKIERMHRSLKNKISYDLKHCGRSGISWVKQLPKYRHILNKTQKECLGWRSPHDIYFGRGPGGAKFIRKKAAKASKLIDSRTDRRHKSQSSVLRIGKNVYIRVKKPGKVSKYSVVIGKILKRKAKRDMYLVRYRICKEREMTNKWHHISNISDASDLKTIHRLNYYIVKSTSNDIESLRSDFGFEMLFNPPGDGNCQFGAVANQLQSIGIHRSPETLREEIVRYLRSNSHFGSQRSPWWEYTTDSRDVYITGMSTSGTYGDHITLQAMSANYNIQILVVSTVNDHTTLITPSGEQTVSDDIPVMVLGHYPENNGEHYVSLRFEKQTFMNVVQNSPQILMESDICNITDDASSEKYGEREENNTASEHSGICGERESNYQFLPNDVLEIIIQMTLAVDPFSRHSLKKVNSFFESVVNQVRPPEIYLNPNLYSNTSKYPISVRKIMNISGKGSGVVQEIKTILQNKSWANAWLFLHMVSFHGWYEILRVWYRKMRKR